MSLSALLLLLLLVLAWRIAVSRPLRRFVVTLAQILFTLAVLAAFLVVLMSEMEWWQ